MSSLLPLALIAQTNIFRVIEIKSRESFGNKQTNKPNHVQIYYYQWDIQLAQLADSVNET